LNGDTVRADTFLPRSRKNSLYALVTSEMGRLNSGTLRARR
jgi:hypothetical protein